MPCTAGGSCCPSKSTPAIAGTHVCPGIRANRQLDCGCRVVTFACSTWDKVFCIGVGMGRRHTRARSASRISCSTPFSCPAAPVKAKADAAVVYQHAWQQKVLAQRRCYNADAIMRGGDISDSSSTADPAVNWCIWRAMCRLAAAAILGSLSRWPTSHSSVSAGARGRLAAIGFVFSSPCFGSEKIVDAGT